MNPVERRVDQEGWERGYRGDQAQRSAAAAIRRTGAYHEYLLLDILYPRVLGDISGLKLVEIGSAPGRHLVQLAEIFRVEPYGIELTDAGVELNREIFARHGLDPSQVIQADLFESEFREEHRESFNVVLSRGFLEHFSNPGEVVRLHLELLAPGGRLVVVIPNLRGVYGAWQRRFNPELLARHELETMRFDVFREAFDHPELMELHCGYLGTFDTWALRVGRERGAWLHRVAHLLQRAQVPLNVVMRSLFGARGFETATFSPFLIYIGRKRDEP